MGIVNYFCVTFSHSGVMTCKGRHTGRYLKTLPLCFTVINYASTEQKPAGFLVTLSWPKNITLYLIIYQFGQDTIVAIQPIMTLKFSIWCSIFLHI